MNCLRDLAHDSWVLPRSRQCEQGPFSASLLCSRIVDKMHDSSSGIRPCPNMEQGSTYKKTFLGEPVYPRLETRHMVTGAHPIA